MNTNWKTALLLSMGLSLLLAALPAVHAANANKKDSGNKVEAPADKQEDDVRKVLMDFVNAVNAGDAVKAASVWSPDATFIDESGVQVNGRAALQDRLTKGFKDHGAAAIVGLHPEKLTFPAANVALVVGAVSHKNGSLDLPSSRCSLVLVKQGDAWLINEATATAIQEVKAADHLQELAWLVGKWQVDEVDGAAKLDAEWGAGRNFIVSKCTISRNDVQQVDSQVIGWDPRTSSIVSWHFDANGGFGYGKWSKQGDRWLVDFAGVGADGSSTRATNVFTVTNNPDEFSWQSTEQSADGVTIADTQAHKIKRAKQ